MICTNTELNFVIFFPLLPVQWIVVFSKQWLLLVLVDSFEDYVEVS